ncbi:MAG: hypothetical protein ACXV5Q_17235 [Frankiaceae bacterium]
MTARLLAVCVVGPDLFPLPGHRPNRSGIDKRPVAGRVAVLPLGLDGDVQVNRKHHGGEGQAVYASTARRTPSGGSGRSVGSCRPAGSGRTCVRPAST